MPEEAPPLPLALPMFAVFPEEEEKEWDEDSVLSWSDTPRRHGMADEAISAPCEGSCSAPLAPCAVHTDLPMYCTAPRHIARAHDGGDDQMKCTVLRSA